MDRTENKWRWKVNGQSTNQRLSGKYRFNAVSPQTRDQSVKATQGTTDLTVVLAVCSWW